MIYLNNNTEQQTVYIPKNDGTGSSHKPTRDLEGVEVTITEDITVVHPSSGYYGMSAVTIDASEYAQQNYDLGYSEGENDGYVSGVTDGEQSIIDTFTSTTITINGQYGSSANPYSSVTVNVAQTGHTDQELQEAYNSGYTSGSTDGYNSGYTSGETHQKSLLVSTAFTQNGQYTSENGWNGVTVNIDTASTYNSGYTSGYTSGHTDGVDEEKAKMSAVTFTANTAVTLSDGSYSAVTVNVPQTGGSGVKYIEYIETDGTYIGFDFSTAHTYSSLDETICLDFMPLNGTVYSDTYYGFIGAENMLLWTIPYGYRVNDKYGLSIGDFNMYYGWSSGPTFSAGTRFDCAFSSTGATINNVDYPFTITSVGTPGYIRLNWNGDISNPRCPVARYYGFKIMSGDTVICNYRPAIDNNGIPCFYEETTGEYYYKNPICSGTPIAGPVLDPSYTSGYTDGQNSIINTFTAMTATTNGIYGSSAHPLSSITVDVSSKVISLVDYVHTSVLSASQITAYIDTGIIPTTATTFRVQGMYKGHSQGGVIVGYQTKWDWDDYRMFWAGSDVSPDIYYDFNGDRLGSYPNLLYDGAIVDITCDNYSITLNGSVLGTGTAQTTIEEPHNILLDVGSWWAKSLEIWDNGVKVFDGQASIDSDGNIGLYDSVSMSMVYNSGLTMAYEGTPVPIPSPDYQSGYTDGQESIISTFSSMTATTNGVYGSSANPLSSITVNVPQSGSSLDYANLIQKSISGTCYIPSSCTKIGYGVFGSCTGLTGHLDIPDSITSIGEYSFYDCSGFTGDLIIPNSVTYIGERAFQACFGLTALTLSSSLTYVGIGAFAGCTGLTGNLILPDSLTGIYNFAFANCSSLTGITLGNYVTHIYGYAFSNCSNISSIEIPNSVTNIDNCAFSGCSSLSTIYCYPTTAPYLGSLVFDSVSQNGTLHYPSGSDYSSWQNDSNLSGWTFIGDL